MEFRLDHATPVLQRTPGVLNELLGELPREWTRATEGTGTWSPFDVVGHLIHGERADWIPRTEHLLEYGESKPFPVFDREAMFTASKGHTLRELLHTFEELRAASLERLRVLDLSEAHLAKRGTHPELGSVTLEQHLATWVAHDLSHIAQVVRVMARQYTDAVGPWRQYHPMLREDG